MESTTTPSWRTSLAQDSRQKIVKRIMDTLQRHVAGQDGVEELLKIAWRFEEKIFQAATDQQDYLRKISLKMLSLETKASGNAIQARAASVPGQVAIKPDPAASLLMRNPTQQALNNGVQQPSQSQQQLQQRQQQQLLAQSHQANAALAGTIQSSANGLGSNLSTIAGTPQNSIPNMPGQVMNSTMMNSRLQQMQQQQQQQQQQQAAAQQQQQVVQQQQQQQLLQHNQHQQQMLYQQQQRVQQHQALMKQKLHQQSLLQHQQQQQQQQQSLQQQQQQQPQPQQQVPTTLQQQQQQPCGYNHLLTQNKSTLQQQILQAKQQQQQAQQQLQLQQAQQQQQQQTSAVPSQSQQSQQSQAAAQPAQQTQQQHLLPMVSQQPQQQQQRVPQPGALLQQQQQSMFDQKPQILQRVLPEPSTASVDSSAHSAPSIHGDQREVVWMKLQVLKDKYLMDMNELFNMLSTRSNQPMPAEQLQKLKHYKDVLQRMIPYLRVPKEKVPKEFNIDKVEAFEKQIISIMETFKKRRQPAQQPSLSGGPAGSAQSQPAAPANSGQSQQQTVGQQSDLSTLPKSLPPQQQQQPQMPPLQQIVGSNQGGGQFIQQQQQQQQQLLSQMQQEKQAQQQLQQLQQQLSVSQTPGNMLQPPTSSNSLTSLQQNMGLQQGLGMSTTSQATSAPTSQTVSGAPIPSNSTRSLGQSSLTALQQNSTGMVVQLNVVSTLQPAGGGNVQNGVVNGFQQNNSSNPLQKSPGVTGLHQGSSGGGSSNGQSQSMSIHQQQQAQQQRLIQNQELQKQQLQQRQLQQQQQQLQQQKNQAAQLQAFHAQQQQQQQQQQQPQIVDFTSDTKVDAIKAKQQAVKQVMMQQQIKQRHIQQQLQHQQHQQQALKVGSPQLVSSPQLLQAPSPQQQLSPQPDQSFAAVPVVSKAVTPPFRTPSPSTLPATPPPLHDDSDTKVSVNTTATAGSLQALQPAAMPVSNNAAPITTPGIAVSPLMAEFSPAHLQLGGTQEILQAVSPGTPILDKSNSTEPPLERLMKKIDSIPRATLIAAVNEMNAVISCSDRLAASGPGNGSRAAVGDDLAALTQSRLQVRAIQASSSQDSNLSAKRRRHNVDSMALSTISRDGTLSNSLLHRSFDTTGTVEPRTKNMVSHIKSPQIKVTTYLEEEITEINSRLIDMVVEVSAEGTEDAAAAGLEGVVVACYFKGDAISPNVAFLATQEYSMVQMAPLLLIVPPTYPQSSPTVWSDQTSANTNSPIATATWKKFARASRCLPRPLLLGTMAKCWDECARHALNEAAHYQGGGNFSTSIGIWESCVPAL